jgi:hypothetical protein
MIDEALPMPWPSPGHTPAAAAPGGPACRVHARAVPPAGQVNESCVTIYCASWLWILYGLLAIAYWLLCLLASLDHH